MQFLEFYFEIIFLTIKVLKFDNVFNYYILEKVQMISKNEISKEEIINYLSNSEIDVSELFETGFNIKRSFYGNGIVLRGVIEISNTCNVNCCYCPMRKDNTKLNNRYILNENEILKSAKKIKKDKVSVVFFQGGEVPQTTELIAKVIPKIKDLFNDDVEIILNLGIKTYDEFHYLKKQGANSYILKHETSDEILHKDLRFEPLSNRIKAINDLISLGYNVGTGNIIGLPNQTTSSIADDILYGKNLRIKMLSFAPFIPANNTPLSSNHAGSLKTTLISIAIARILYPDFLIPSVSSLNKLSINGQISGIKSGANVLTINYTPELEKNKYLIYGKDRFIVNKKYVFQLLDQNKMYPIKSPFI